MKRLIVWGLLFWTLLCGTYLAHFDSLTTDEGIHVASGYLILNRGDWRFDPEHPPLMKILTALPLLAVHPHLPPDDQLLWEQAKPTLFDAWKPTREWTDQWFFRSGNNADLMVFLMRLPAVATLTALAYFSFVLAKQWFGERVGLVTLFLVAFNPTLLGHGHLANDDVAVAFGILAVLFCLRRWYKAPSYWSAIALGAALALSIGFKFSGLIALVPVVAVFIVAIYRKIPFTKRSVLVSFGTLLALIWLFYGFRSPFFSATQAQANEFVVNQRLYLSSNTLASLLLDWRWLLPIPFLKGIALVRSSTIIGRGAYVLGHTYYPGVWFYFPIVFLLKTQLVALLAGAWGILSLQWKRLKLNKIENWLLTLTIAAISATAISSKLDLGIRHIAALLPLLSIALACFLAKRNLPVVALFIPFYLLPVLVQSPYLLGYTNALIFPYSNGWKYIDGSNLDWGQQAKEAAQLVEKRYPGATASTNYYWNNYALGYYGLKTVPLDPAILPVGQPILVTASTLNDDSLEQLRRLKPVASVANSTFVYYINP